MAAAATDKFQKVSIATATTLDAPGYTIGDTSITVASTSTWPTDTGITFAIDEVDANGDRVAGSYNEYVGVVSTGTSITSVSHVNGTNRNYTAGTTSRVYIPVSEERENRLAEGILVHADQDGTLKAGAVHSAAVLANDVVTTPKILDDAVTAPKVSGLDRSNLTVDSNPYKFSVYRNAAANTGNAAFAVLACDTELFDTNSNVASGVYTVPVNGFYAFSACMSVAASGSDIAIAIFKNGSEVARGTQVTINANISCNVTTLIQCTAGDTIDTRVYGSATRALNVGVANQNYFTGFLVSRT